MDDLLLKPREEETNVLTFLCESPSAILVIVTEEVRHDDRNLRDSGKDVFKMCNLQPYFASYEHLISLIVDLIGCQHFCRSSIRSESEAAMSFIQQDLRSKRPDGHFAAFIYI